MLMNMGWIKTSDLINISVTCLTLYDTRLMNR